MQSQTQTQTPIFLDYHLRTQTTPPSPPPLPPPVRSILQAWSDLRSQTNLHPSLQTLASHPSLHVADPHARTLLSLLPSLPPHSLTLLLRLLHVWARKSSFHSPPLLASAVDLVSSSPSPVPELVLLLGALAAVPKLPDPSRNACLDCLCRVLEEFPSAVKPDAVPEVLAGIGYALSRCDGVYFGRIVGLSFRIWGGDGPPGNLEHGLMVLALAEWLVSGFISSRLSEKVEVLCGEVSVEKLRGGGYARFAVVMFSAGILRAFRRDGRLELSVSSRSAVEGFICGVAGHVVSRVGEGYELDGWDHEGRLLVQCISLGLARCGQFPPNRAVFLSVCFALLNDVFPFSFLVGSNAGDKLKETRQHLDGILFREGGAVTGILCNQYSSAREEDMLIVEHHMWVYSREFYSKLRTASLLFRGGQEELFKELEKMAESIFLMVVVFAAAVCKQKLDIRSSYSAKSEVASKILVAFSCIEYLRRVRWPEYTHVVRCAVLILQESSLASNSFLDSMPSYDDLTEEKGLLSLKGSKYSWSEDDVQTARILFYLRVIPTCINQINGPIFIKKVTPTMFLYLCHPNVKVSQASHSVFVAFISSERDSNQASETEEELKEQLVFYYMQRALEAYPDLTPHKGLAAGVTALVRHLPAGSPAIFYCINSLMEKTTHLYNIAIREDASLWKNWQGDSEPCKKVLELLLHLISIVDIQVLPNLLKLLAQFITQLPNEGQKIVLDDIYSRVAESDDVTRKPTLVSWIQSLSYISSQATTISSSTTYSRL